MYCIYGHDIDILLSYNRGIFETIKLFSMKSIDFRALFYYCVCILFYIILELHHYYWLCNTQCMYCVILVQLYQLFATAFDRNVFTKQIENVESYYRMPISVAREQPVLYVIYILNSVDFENDSMAYIKLYTQKLYYACYPVGVMTLSVYIYIYKGVRARL